LTIQNNNNFLLQHRFSTNSMADYSKIPSGATLDIQPFKAHVSEEKLQHFKDLLKLSPIGPAVFENTNCERRYGTTREWLSNAKDHWLNTYDWRKCEDRTNSYPNFKATVKDSEDNDIEVQFLALFSEKQDAIPIGFYHGWPGSILEFYDMLDLLKKKYEPKDLPYHVIVPSLPGYCYSSGPPLDRDYATDIAAGAMHNLMIGLGFGNGYLAQGGDIGSFISRILAGNYDACKGMHVNMMAIPPPDNARDLEMDELETEALPRGGWFYDVGAAYMLEHGTRTATIGLVLSSSPLALLSW
jgi:microsomal epoxide hydrolase